MEVEYSLFVEENTLPFGAMCPLSMFVGWRVSLRMYSVHYLTIHLVYRFKFRNSGVQSGRGPQ